MTAIPAIVNRASTFVDRGAIVDVDAEHSYVELLVGISKGSSIPSWDRCS